MQVLILRPYRKDNIYFRTIEEREKISSENKGADQLRGYREADLRLCFCICKKKRFSRKQAHLTNHTVPEDIEVSVHYFAIKDNQR